jgi:hypothetical protein
VSTESNNRGVLILGTLVSIIGMAAYHGALTAGFVFDDYLLFDNWCWQIESLSELMSVPDRPMCGYRSLRNQSLAIDHLLWGTKAGGYHLTNLLLHGLIILLVFRLLRRLTASTYAAAVVALVWAIHPVHADTVTYVAGRRDLLCTLFFLAAFESWPWRRSAGLWMVFRAAVALGLFYLAVGAKEMAITLPAVVILGLIFRSSLQLARDGQPFDSPLRTVFTLLTPKRLLLLLPLLITAGWLFVQKAILDPMSLRKLWGGDLLHHVGTVLAAYARYLELIVFPARLYGDYSDYPIVTGLADVRIWIGAAFLLAIWVGGLLFARRRPFLSFGLLWFGITMLPVSHIIPHHELMAEHYLYLPLIGLAIAATRGLAIGFANPAWRLRLQIAVACVAVLFTIRLSARNAEFQSEITFANAIIAEVPDAIRARLTLSHGLHIGGQSEESAEVLRWVVDHIDRGHRLYYPTHRSLMTVYAALGDLEQSEHHAFVILNEVSGSWLGIDALRMVGTIRAQQGYLDKAEVYLRRSWERNREDVETALHFGTLLLSMERVEEAETCLAIAVERWPRNPDAHFQWAMLNLARGGLDVAAEHLELALIFDPTHIPALEQLIFLNRDAGYFEMACTLYEHLRTLRTELPPAGDECRTP